MFDWTENLKKRSTEHLNPGEEYQAASSVEAPGILGRGLAGGMGGAIGRGAAAVAHNKAIDEAEMTFAGTIAGTLPLQKAVIVVTNQRFLMFTYGGMITLKAKELIFELPRDQVSHSTFKKGKLVDKIELHFADGSAANFEIGRAAKLSVVAEALGSAPVE